MSNNEGHEIELSTLCTELRDTGYAKAADILENQEDKIDSLEEHIERLEGNISWLNTWISLFEEEPKSNSD